jgi:hypothetical protein
MHSKQNWVEEDYLRAELEFVIEKYQRRLTTSKLIAARKAIDILLDIIQGEHSNTSTSLPFTTPLVQRAKQESSPYEIKTFSYMTEEEDIEDTIGNPSKKLKSDYTDNVKRQIEQTKSDFKMMMDDMDSSGIGQTDAPGNLRILRLHLISASLIDRFAMKPKSADINIESISEKILGACQNPPLDPSDTEKRCLEELNKTLKKSFKSNKVTYYNTVFCGTPDATLIEGGKVVSAAEFKSDTQRAAAVNQLVVYMTILKIKSGYICLYSKSGNCIVEKVNIATKSEDDLKRRIETYHAYRAALQNK